MLFFDPLKDMNQWTENENRYYGSGNQNIAGHKTLDEKLYTWVYLSNVECLIFYDFDSTTVKITENSDTNIATA